MATKYHNLSSYDADKVPSAETMRFGIAVAEWNGNITFALLTGAVDTLMVNGAKEENIDVEIVPGCFELTFAAKAMADSGKYDALIIIGCVVRGDTPHFDYICEGVTAGATQINAEGKVPCIFGVLTTNTMQQAIDRAGGVLGNKGDEAAVTAIRMADLAKRVRG